MTISPDARIPSADVHALSGSSAGPGHPFAPVATVYEMPDPFVLLGDAAAGVVAGLTARRSAPRSDANTDAELIDLAGRVERLIAREDRIVLRTVKIEDAVMHVKPRYPVEAEGVLRITYQRTVDDDGTRVTIIREPAGWTAEVNANRKAFEAALAERERCGEDEAARRGLPQLAKLRDRAAERLERWALRLAEMKPVTHTGLSAKAAAAAAAAEGDELPDDWRQILSVSVSRDAARLLSAPKAVASFPADARLIALADAYEAVEAACNAHTAAHRGREDDASEDGFDAIASGLAPIEQEIAETPADTMAGVLAKARAAQVPPARGFGDCPFAMSIADDLWRLFGTGSSTDRAAPAPLPEASAA